MSNWKTIQILTLALGMALSFPTLSFAQAIAPQTCNTDVWKTMEDRARLETQREIMQNQNLIFKADSVLSYTCFDKFAAHGAKHLGVLFTHTTYWNGTAIFPEGGARGALGMGAAVDGAVRAAMTSYIQGNFHGTGGVGGAPPIASQNIPLGGRGSEFGLSAPSILTPIPTGGADYSCGEMSRVWGIAKCMNFMHTSRTAGTDGFYPFKDLAGYNGSLNVDGYESKSSIRGFPYSCGSYDTTPVTGGWSDMTNSSRNSENGQTFNRHYEFGTDTGQSFTDVRTFLDPAASCQTIRTGVRIVLSPAAAAAGGTSQPDGVCTNPGCSYINGTCTKSASAPPACPPGGGPC